ncbi:MAG TPA: nuclear transport factor 2 family protein [Thermoleophilaceae bacterium]|nr:nuclear transport factor 2 family protein [Thermoleophilaceae bacterium]
MSQGNVEIILDSFEAFSRGDLDAVVAILDEDVEWKQIEEPEPVRGPEAVLQAVGRWTEMWDGARVSVRECIDAGDTVVLLLHWSGRSKASGVPAEQSAYNVFTMRAGKVVRMREYGADSRAEALTAAGVSG